MPSPSKNSFGTRGALEVDGQRYDIFRLAELEKRGLRAQIDTSTGDDIHVAAFKSYHTSTPNGYNLQISYVTHDTQLALPTAVRPKQPGTR